MTLGGLVGSETLGYSGASASDAHVVTAGKSISAITLLDGTLGGLAANYQLPVLDAAHAPVTITAKAISATASIGGTLSKTYSGTTAATGASVSGSVSGAISGDTLALDTSGLALAYNSAHVAGASSIQSSGSAGFSIVASSAASQASDYSFTGPVIAPVAASITPATLTATLTNTGVSKTYDGNTNAPAGLVPAYGFGGLVSGDTTATLTHTGSAFNNAHVNGASTLTVSGLAIAGITGSNSSAVGDYVLDATAKSVAASISRRDISLTGLTAAGKTYDGSTAASITGASFANLVGSESLGLSGSGSFDNRNAGNGKTVTVADVTALTPADGSGQWSDYRLTSSGSLDTSADIARKAVTLTAASVAKTYDGLTSYGTRAADLAVLSSQLGVNGDSVSAASIAYLDRNAGSGKTVTLNAVTLADGNAGNNYSVTLAGNSSSSIARKSVNLVADSVGKTYDGTLAYNVQAADLDALGRQLGVSGDTVTAAGMAFLDKNAGSGKSLALNSVAVSDGNAGNNYTLTLSGNSSSTIAKADAVVTGNSDTRTYNGSSQTVSGFSASGLVPGETASVLSGVSASGAGRNAGSYAVTPSGSDGNYNLVFVNGVLQINRAPLTAPLTGTVQKQYDGLTSVANLANANFALAGWVGDEGATVTQTSGSYASQNVSDNPGNGLVSTTLAASHFSARAGTDLANYQLPTAASGAVGRITPAPLDVQVNHSATFVTLNANNAPDMGFSFTGLQNGETAASVLGSLSRSYTGTSATPAAGTYSGVLGLAGTPVAAHGNYSVSVRNGNLVVAPADHMIITIGSASAVYDQRNASAAAATAHDVRVDYLAGGSTLAQLAMQDLGNGQWQATDATGQTLRFSTLLNGASAVSGGGNLPVGNYTYGATPSSGSARGNFGGELVNGGVLNITPRLLAVSGNAIAKTYDDNSSLPGATLTPDNRLAGDALGVGFGAGSFAGRNAGVQAVSLSGLSLSGADRANYALASNSFSGSGTITARSVTLSASGLSKTYDGTTSYSASPFDLAQLSNALGVAGDQVSAVTLAYAKAAAGNTKTVSTRDAVVSDGNGGANYQLSYANSSSNQILPREVRLVGVTAADKAYDGSAQAEIVSGNLLGLVAGETLGVQGVGSLTDKNAGSNKTVSVADASTLTRVDGTGLWSNYRLASGGTLQTTTNIAKKSLTLRVGSISKTYDGVLDYSAQSADLQALSSQLGVSGDRVSAATLAYLDANAGSGKALTLSDVVISDGNGGGNYQLSLEGNSSSVITPARLSVRALDALKAQDGNAFVGGNGVAYSGFVHGETAAVLGGTLAYGGNSQGALLAGSYAINAQGLSAANYVLDYQSGTLRIVAPPPLPPQPPRLSEAAGSAGSTGFGNGAPAGA
ncbi:MAG: hypothetical protein HXX19_07340, partial [Rhodoferax sp.]|nr:hypothetical protein [Rhodoferax sp.]